MNRVRIKFCGITRPEDAEAAAALGVDALGFVFTSRSPRAIDPAKAVSIIRQLPPMLASVALFMDDDPAWIRQVVSVVRPQLIQFHGSESPSDCAGYGLPFLKAVPMGSVTDVASYAAGFASAAGFLLDAHAAGEGGGQGKRFDWSHRPQLDRPWVLAGGLDSANIVEAIHRLGPYAVDVSSGIESSPGIKDAGKMQAFVSAVNALSCQ
jgi:phosphoribosylanthranilate isomerase